MNNFLFGNLEPLTLANLIWYLSIYIGCWLVWHILEVWPLNYLGLKIQNKSTSKSGSAKSWYQLLYRFVIPLFILKNKTKIVFALISTLLIIYRYQIGIN